jgi:hexosaminidase
MMRSVSAVLGTLVMLLAVPAASPPPFGAVIPRPESVQAAEGLFTLGAEARIVVHPARGEARRAAETLAALLRQATGYRLGVEPAGARAPAGGISVRRVERPALGAEGYELRITASTVTLSANRAAGLFRGIQTIRQLLPAAIERSAVQPGPWLMRTGTIRDRPRFAWRGAMLDVARHFFGVEDVKRFVDLLAFHKLNRLHLHLTDDQGWRIAIRSWPRLASYGGSTAVGGGPGGFYTQEDYREIVAYASGRYVTVVPEIDMPGHTNAALSSYPRLSCDGVARPLYTGIEVGFSSLCTDKEVVYGFVDDVVRELAALTPTPYLHVGGDEAAATSPAGYATFLERVQRIVRAHGKHLVGWEETAHAGLQRGAIVQHWRDEGLARRAVERGARLIMSPATKAYLDMKYDAATSLGLDWAGYTSVRDAYDWDPATKVDGVGERDVLGVEAPVWTETLRTMADVEHMAFPRLAGIAELGWSPARGRTWKDYRLRLAAHGARLQALGVNFHRAPGIPWR